MLIPITRIRKLTSVDERWIASMRRCAAAGRPFRRGKVEVDLRKFRDFLRLRVIMRYLVTPSRGQRIPDHMRGKFVQWSYHDHQLVTIYKYWKRYGQHPLLRPTLDHKTPLSRGGKHTIKNFQWLQLAANNAKGRMTQSEWKKKVKREGWTRDTGIS